MMRRRLLLLSTTTGYQLRSFGDAASELGVELVFATDRCHSLFDPWRDSAVPVRFHEERESIDAVLNVARQRPLDGVLAVGDRPVVLAAQIAAALGLPGNPLDGARASAHKRLTRERLARAGLPVPWHAGIKAGEDPARIAANIVYPAVVKPVGLSGSRGVIRVNDHRELLSALQRVSTLVARTEIRGHRTGIEQDLLIEGFIEGREFAIEGLLTRGRFRPLALFDKPDPLDGPFFEETLYVTPSVLPGGAQQHIFAAVERAAEALGLWHGPIHAECRTNGDRVFVLEVAARPIGGLCSKVLRFDDGGGAVVERAEGRRSLEYLLVRHALGEDVSNMARESSAAAVMMIPIPRRGIYRGVDGEHDARAVQYVEDVRITAKRDQLLEPLPEAGSYLGFIFARAPRREDADAAVREAHARLTFVVDPAIDVMVNP